MLRVNGSDGQKQRLYAEVLAGQRFDDALANWAPLYDRVTPALVIGSAVASSSTGAVTRSRIRRRVVDENGSNWPSSRAQQGLQR